MFGLLSKAKPISENDVIKNAILDAFLDNCQGLPLFEVNEDDFSLSLVFRYSWPYGRISIKVRQSFNMWAISITAQDPSETDRICYSKYTQTTSSKKIRSIVSKYLLDALETQTEIFNNSQK